MLTFNPHGSSSVALTIFHVVLAPSTRRGSSDSLHKGKISHAERFPLSPLDNGFKIPVRRWRLAASHGKLHKSHLSLGPSVLEVALN